MELKQAETLAQEVVDQLAPYCTRIEVVGSIRRRKAFPNDIDILLIPANQGLLAGAIVTLGTKKKWGPAIVQRTYKGQQVDLYFATPQTWDTLLLIRTGSMASNIRLASRAKAKGWRLYANGDGLFNGLGEKAPGLFWDSAGKGERIAGDSEESIFLALGLPYLEPWDRE